VRHRDRGQRAEIGRERGIAARLGGRSPGARGVELTWCPAVALPVVVMILLPLAQSRLGPGSARRMMPRRADQMRFRAVDGMTAPVM